MGGPHPRPGDSSRGWSVPSKPGTLRPPLRRPGTTTSRNRIDARGATTADETTADERLLRARRRLRAELAQLLCALVGLGLGLVLPRLTGDPSMSGNRLVAPLITLGIGVIGVVSLVYSLLFGVVQWSASSFSPRLRLFRGDPLVWRTFAFAIGVFVYCATAALASADRTRVPVLVPGTAILGVLATVALIRQLQVRAFRSLQLAYVLETVSAEGRAVIEGVYPVRRTVADPVPDEPSRLHPPRLGSALRRTLLWSGGSGVVQQLDLLELIERATEADAVIAFRVGVGDTVHHGTPLADIHGGDVPDDVVDECSRPGLRTLLRPGPAVRLPPPGGHRPSRTFAGRQRPSHGGRCHRGHRRAPA